MCESDREKGRREWKQHTLVCVNTISDVDNNEERSSHRCSATRRPESPSRRLIPATRCVLFEKSQENLWKGARTSIISVSIDRKVKEI
ncbi:hypothetical protein L1887_14390 [Cichorium endivia]|nr:hypothetical protein L1887_14390 [Cichorium endivia]